MDLLNLHQPWDCERFPKSKTICYGGMGRFGDTELAHVNPKEKAMLKAMGGSGTINPKTGLKEYHWRPWGHNHSSSISIPTPKITIPKSTGDIGIVSDIADATGYTGSDVDTVAQATEGAVKGFVDDVTGAVVDAGEAVSGSYESGEFNPAFYMSSMGGPGFGGFSYQDWSDFSDNASDFVDDVGTGITSTVQSVATDVAQSDIGKAVSAGAENIKKEGTKAVNQIKQEGGKLASGDFSLKNAIQGTASGASETFKKSDVGKVTKKIAKETGYTGSDFDKSMQKVETEGANVVSQGLDVIDQPGKYVAGKLEEFKQYAAERLGYSPKEEKKSRRGKIKIATPGSDKTIGQGNIEGLKGGGSLAASERSRIRQNKRKLRIARA